MGKSVMKHQFSQVPKADIPRSSFDRSHGHKTTLQAGLLVPIFVDEALPGDTFKLNMTGLARMATPIFPIMDNLVMDTHFFAVPVRLLWSNWEKFNGAQDNPGDSTDFLIPQMTSPVGVGYAEGSLEDYFGLPVGVPGVKHSALWHRGYAKIFNEWYRDQNLVDSLPVYTNDGPDPAPGSPGAITLQRRAKRHDYFTAGLPWPQKGQAVQIPLGGSAPVVSNNQNILFKSATEGPATLTFTGATPVANWGATPTVTAPVQFGTATGLETDLTQATAATINSLRQAFQIQKIFERDARGGTRYIETIKAHFQVSSPDFRLQRSEYLGGGSSPVNFTPIPQNSPTGAYANTPQGNLAAMATSVLRNNGFSMAFTEHCIIIGIISVRADLTYQQGLNRMWSRRTRFDFYWPALSQIGEQAILQKEIFASGVPAEDDTVFAYQERYAEYRYKPSLITGLFRSSAALSLDAWHLSQDFATAPVLNQAFIEENPPMDRIIAVPTQPHFLFDSHFSMRCTRPMPVYGVPGLIDHF